MDAALEVQPPDSWDSFPLFQLLNDFLRIDCEWGAMLVIKKENYQNIPCNWPGRSLKGLKIAPVWTLVCWLISELPRTLLTPGMSQAQIKQEGFCQLKCFSSGGRVFTCGIFFLFFFLYVIVPTPIFTSFIHYFFCHYYVYHLLVFNPSVRLLQSKKSRTKYEVLKSVQALFPGVCTLVGADFLLTIEISSLFLV